MELGLQPLHPLWDEAFVQEPAHAMSGATTDTLQRLKRPVDSPMRQQLPPASGAFALSFASQPMCRRLSPSLASVTAMPLLSPGPPCARKPREAGFCLPNFQTHESKQRYEKTSEGFSSFRGHLSREVRGRVCAVRRVRGAGLLSAGAGAVPSWPSTRELQATPYHTFMHQAKVTR